MAEAIESQDNQCISVENAEESNKIKTNKKTLTELKNRIGTQSAGKKQVSAQGNWATHIYIPIELSDDQINFSADFKRKLEDSIGAHLIQCEDIHISLSKSFSIKTYLIEPLWKNLDDNLKSFSKFEVRLNFIRAFYNEERTRVYFSFNLDDKAHEILLPIVRSIDSCLEAVNCPTYYKRPKFHISFCWCQSSNIDIMQLNHLIKSFFNDEISLTTSTFSVKKIQFKFGNRFFNHMLE